MIVEPPGLSEVTVELRVDAVEFIGGPAWWCRPGRCQNTHTPIQKQLQSKNNWNPKTTGIQNPHWNRCQRSVSTGWTRDDSSLDGNSAPPSGNAGSTRVTAMRAGHDFCTSAASVQICQLLQLNHVALICRPGLLQLLPTRDQCELTATAAAAVAVAVGVGVTWSSSSTSGAELSYIYVEVEVEHCWSCRFLRTKLWRSPAPDPATLGFSRGVRRSPRAATPQAERNTGHTIRGD